MTTTDLAIRTDLSVADAESRVRDRLSDEGFGVLTEIDIAATLKEKIGVDRPPYRLIGACRPQLASRSLDIEPDVGLLLPCNIAVYANPDGTTTVAAMDPGAMVEMTGNEDLAPIAAEARDRLLRVLASLGRDD